MLDKTGVDDVLAFPHGSKVAAPDPDITPTFMQEEGGGAAQLSPESSPLALPSSH